MQNIESGLIFDHKLSTVLKIAMSQELGFKISYKMLGNGKNAVKIGEMIGLKIVVIIQLTTFLAL